MGSWFHAIWSYKTVKSVRRTVNMCLCALCLCEVLQMKEKTCLFVHYTTTWKSLSDWEYSAQLTAADGSLRYVLQVGPLVNQCNVVVSADARCDRTVI